MTWVMFKCLLQLLDGKQHIKKRKWGLETSQEDAVSQEQGREGTADWNGGAGSGDGEDEAELKSVEVITGIPHRKISKGKKEADLTSRLC